MYVLVARYPITLPPRHGKEVTITFGQGHFLSDGNRVEPGFILNHKNSGD